MIDYFCRFTCKIWQSIIGKKCVLVMPFLYLRIKRSLQLLASRLISQVSICLSNVPGALNTAIADYIDIIIIEESIREIFLKYYSL